MPYTRWRPDGWWLLRFTWLIVMSTLIYMFDRVHTVMRFITRW